MNIYTKTGDEGETSLLDDSRVSKTHVRICACGDLDELNSLLGWCRLAGCSFKMSSNESIDKIKPIKNFLLPGGVELSCRLHMTRTCCRRAERSVVSVSLSESIRSEIIAYLNRLGDLLFVWSAQINREAGIK